GIRDFHVTGVQTCALPIYPLNDFRDRIYLGEHFAGQIPETVAEFLSKKDQIMDTVANFPDLPKMRKKEITIYLSEWFSLLENQRSEERRVGNECRSRCVPE